MPRQMSLVKVKPDVLKWTIDSSGWEDEELAKKLRVSSQTLDDWKTKSVGIEIKKLEKLSECVKRPLALFFLQAPPDEPKLADYRKLPKDERIKLTKTTVTAIRNARYLQSVAHELLKMQGIDPKPKIDASATLRSSPEIFAKSERKRLGFESKDTFFSKEARKPAREFYDALRRRIESLNIFVFQGSMPIHEVRGLTLSDKYPRVIMINSKDTVPAKIFSLLHEYGHILLQKDGMCIPQDVLNQNDDDLQIVEAWCNKFAASVLMPQKEFLDELKNLQDKEEDLRKIVNSLSSKFRASKQATVIRIKTLTKGTLSMHDYNRILNDLKKEHVKDASKKESKGGPGVVDICVSQKGKKFVSLVLESKRSKNITNSDVIDYLNLNLKHMQKLQERIL